MHDARCHGVPKEKVLLIHNGYMAAFVFVYSFVFIHVFIR